MAQFISKSQGAYIALRKAQRAHEMMLAFSRTSINPKKS